MRLSATVLGEVQVLADEAVVDLGGARQRRILGALLVHRGNAVSTDDLVEATFGDDPPDAAWRTFRTYVARLRRALDAEGLDGSAVILTVPSGYATCAGLALDADRFEELLRSAQDQLDAGESGTALSTVEEALALWAGPAYGEFAADDWARPDAVRLEELRLVAREVRAAAMVESGRHDEAIADVRGLIEAAPLREEPRRLLMLGLYRSGRHAEALRAGRDFRAELADETGLDWSSRLAELEQMIIDRDPRLDVAPEGRKLRGYILGETLAETDHGITYRASQPAVGRDVAITVIPPELADDASFIRRFERHAQRIASIEHPNVVPLYDFWREPGGAYLVTRYMVGGSLAARLDAQEAMSPDEAARIVTEVGGALEASAERGVAHGRLTPATVLFDEAGRAHLAGFAVEEIDDARGLDLVAYADLAGVLWDRVTATVGGDGTPAAPDVAAVERVVARARREPAAFGGINGLTDALLGAARGDELHDEPLVESSVTIEGPNPYRGLHAFGETDVDVFFGRRTIVDQLGVDLRRDSFVALIGPSGSGKSSVARAGLLPVLRDTGAFIASMVPGAHPVAELEIALSRVATTPVPDLTPVLDQPDGLRALLADVLPDDAHLVLLIDQLEEAVTMSDGVERDLVFAALTREVREPDSRVQIVVTVRADFLGRILEHPVIGPLVRDHSRLVTPLDSDELYEAIVEPAGAAGVAVEPELATALVADAIDSPGSLPLLQFALTELYEHRTDGTMTLDAYRRMGGLAAPIAQRAEEVFSSLTTDEQAATRRLFGRLITLGEGAEDTRRRVVRSELATVPQPVLDVFGAARLLTFDRDPRTREPTVEIAHEALIRRWPRLHSWLDDDRADLLVLRHLTASAASWEAADRDPSELYRGSRLATAEEWAQRHGDEMTPLESEFLDAGRSERDRDLERDRRRARRLRALTVGLAVVAVLALVAGAVALVQRGRADDNAAAAEERRIEADEQRALAEENAIEADAQATEADAQRELAVQSAADAERQRAIADVERLTAQANATMEDDPDLPILLTLEAYRRAQDIGEEPPGDLISAMQTAVQSSRLLHEFTGISGVGAMSPDGSTVIGNVLEGGGDLIAYDADSHQEIGRIEGDGWVGHVAFSPTGEEFLVLANPFPEASDSGATSAVRVIDATTLETMATLDAASCCLNFAEFSPDGRQLAAKRFSPIDQNASAVLVWDLSVPDEPPVVHDRSDLVGWMPDGTIVTIEPIDPDTDIVRFVDPATTLPRGPEMQIDGIEFIDLSPQGDRLLVVREDVAVWPVGATGPTVSLDTINANVGFSARWSPDGTAIVQFGNDDEVRVTDVASGDEVSLPGNRGGVIEVSLSDDGTRLSAFGDDSTRLWDLSQGGPAELGNLPTEGTVDMLRFTADGSTAIAFEQFGPDGRLRTFDLASAREVASTSIRPANVAVASDDGIVATSAPTADLPGRVEQLGSGPLFELDPCVAPNAIDDQGRWLLLSPKLDEVRGIPLCAAGAGTVVDLETGALRVDFQDRLFDAAMFGPSGTIAEDLFIGRSFSLDENGRVVGAIEIRRMPGGELVDSLPGGDRLLWRPLISADGRYVTVGSGATGGYAIDVQRVLDGATMQDAIVINPLGNGGVVTWPDVGGGWFVMGQSGGELRFYDLESGVEEMTLPVDTGRSTMFRITADGRTLYYQGAGGVLRRFPLDHAELAELAERRVQRDFTEAECERFAIADDCSIYEAATPS